MSKEIETEETAMSSLHHTYRLSLTLTRRVVRRVIELEQLILAAPLWTPTVKVSAVPDTASFQFSVRMLRRVVHRLVEQAQLA